MSSPSANWLTQTDRLLVLSAIPGCSSVVVIEHISGTESISQPFSYKLTLLSLDDSLDLAALLRKAVTVSVVLADGTTRYISGILSSIQQGGLQDDNVSLYEAVLVPSIWLLSRTADCRIFQNLTVQQIVTSVLSSASITAYRFSLTGTYTAREYCVQYRETALNFISRLLEEEGIFYYFEHSESGHTIVFSDTSSALPTCVQATVTYSEFGNQRGWASEDEILSLVRTQAIQTDKITLTDYNFTTPAASLLVTESTPDVTPVAEVYDYPGEYADLSDGQRYSRVRMEEQEVDLFVVEGSGRVRAFSPGYTFTLQGHFRSDTNIEYLLTAASVEAFDKTYRLGHSEGDPFSFTSAFAGIPTTQAYRPPRRAARPVVYGSQTAVVVGTSGSEIYSDNYGRVKVQFYWDRLGTKDENSSCWIRVSQIWAGKNWGWVTIPRIGQEVIVDFLEGNPDQPLITGRVYNADQMPPYTLPDNQTQSGILTRSSLNGTADNCNEIKFEDLKGSEFISIHAEKDMMTTVENDDTQKVQQNRKIEVDGTHTEKIVKDTTITITEGNHSLTLNQGNQSVTLDQGNQSTTISTGNQSTTISKGNQSTTISMGNQSITISMGNQTTSVSLGSITTEAMQSIKLSVAGSSILISPTGITISAPMVTVSADATCSIDGGGLLSLTGALTTIN
jgi:type VI secretion system secreted protein VgrG